MKNHFDHIIIGAGCAGLSLVVKMVASHQFGTKKILIIDKAPKTTNDRTWCFWERQPGFFEPIVHHCWDRLYVKNDHENLLLNTGGYTYKMIRGIDFYAHCFSIIGQQSNITVLYGEVSDINTETGTVKIGDNEFIGNQVFSSVLLEPPFLKPGQFYLLQHFRGWWVEAETDIFDAYEADLMDFRTSQKNGCAFVYLLPVTKRKALVEYTLFSESMLDDEAYNTGLERFLANCTQLKNYKVNEVENGVIPMTNLQFPQQKGKVFFIGTAGGQTKASTGYTFQFIQKQTTAIVQQLIKTGSPDIAKVPARFGFYDSVLLRILSKRKTFGAEVFFKMFKKNKASTVFKFLDNETNLMEELKLMNTTDKSVFVPAAIEQLFTPSIKPKV